MVEYRGLVQFELEESSVCLTCGVLVVSWKLHDAWHDIIAATTKRQETP